MILKTEQCAMCDVGVARQDQLQDLLSHAQLTGTELLTAPSRAIPEETHQQSLGIGSRTHTQTGTQTDTGVAQGIVRGEGVPPQLPAAVALLASRGTEALTAGQTGTGDKRMVFAHCSLSHHAHLHFFFRFAEPCTGHAKVCHAIN